MGCILEGKEYTKIQHLVKGQQTAFPISLMGNPVLWVGGSGDRLICCSLENTSLFFARGGEKRGWLASFPGPGLSFAYLIRRDLQGERAGQPKHETC